MQKLARLVFFFSALVLAVLALACSAGAGTALSGRMIGISPGHGREWDGTSLGWQWERGGDSCPPLGDEDLHNLDDAIWLAAYLQQDGATVKAYRCLDKNFGNCPLTGLPWWQMNASYWLQLQGYPESVYASGYTAVDNHDTILGSGTASEYWDNVDSRALASNYDNDDILIGLHTNAFDGTVSGTEIYYEGSQTIHQPYWTVSKNLATAIYSNVLDSIRNKYGDASWPDRGVKNANGAYHETQIANRPAALLELAFHDNCSRDALYLQDDFFKSTTMWAVYQGVCSYFGITPTYGYYSCDLIGSDIPERMVAGSTVIAHLTFLNHGVVWNSIRGFELKSLNTTDPFTTQTSQLVPNEVKPNETVTFDLTLTAPTTLGAYQTGWTMARQGYSAFGPTAQQVVQVVDASDDTIAPSTPTGLAATPVSYSKINLSWTPSTDNFAVAGYKVFRNGTFVRSTLTPAFADTGLQASTAYTYQVSAYDASGNNSGLSDSASATTLNDGLAPAAPTNVVATGTGIDRMSVTWTAAWDNMAATSYKIFRNGTQVGTTAGTSYAESGLTPGTNYSYQISALDAAGNESNKSAAAIGRTVGLGSQVLFSDDFESYTSQANFAASWPNVSGYTADNWSAAQSFSPTHAAEDTTAGLISIHDLPSPQISVGSFFEFKFYDPAGAANVRHWATVRNYSSGGHAGTLSELLVAGCHYNQTGITQGSYQGRSAMTYSSGTSGWFDLNAPRQAGWHTMRIDVTADPTASGLSGKGWAAWSVDGVVKASNIQFSWLNWTAVTVGSANSSTAGTGSYYYDDVKYGMQGGVQRVSGPTAAEASGAVTITWKTDINSTSRVDYGLTTAYGSLVTDGTLTKTHSITLTGLAPASVYHFKVTSSASGKSDSVSEDFTFATSAASLAGLRSLPNGASCGANGLVVSAVLNNGFYVQDVNRTCGMKVLGIANAQVGSLVAVSGSLDTQGGERVLTNAIVTPAGTVGAPAPLALASKAIGGAAIGTQIPGLTSGTGANNIGLLVKAMGKVTEVGSGVFWIDDGGRIAAANGKVGLKVAADGLLMPAVGDLVTVTGISGAESIGGSIWPVLRPRTDADVIKFGHL